MSISTYLQLILFTNRLQFAPFFYPLVVENIWRNVKIDFCICGASKDRIDTIWKVAYNWTEQMRNARRTKFNTNAVLWLFFRISIGLCRLCMHIYLNWLEMEPLEYFDSFCVNFYMKKSNRSCTIDFFSIHSKTLFTSTFT